MIKFYCRFIDDTHLLLKVVDIPHIYNLFNKTGKSLHFTVDRFENEVPQFLDIKLTPLGLTI